MEAKVRFDSDLHLLTDCHINDLRVLRHIQEATVAILSVVQVCCVNDLCGRHFVVMTRLQTHGTFLVIVVILNIDVELRQKETAHHDSGRVRMLGRVQSLDVEHASRVAGSGSERG